MVIEKKLLKKEFFNNIKPKKFAFYFKKKINKIYYINFLKNSYLNNIKVFGLKSLVSKYIEVDSIITCLKNLKYLFKK